MTNGIAYIIILNYNGWSDTIECLESVLKTTGINYRIVLIDNNSLDESTNKILMWAAGKILAETSSDPRISSLTQPAVPKPIKIELIDTVQTPGDKHDIVLIKSQDNNGFSAGNNLGIRYAMKDPNCNYLWLLNNDTVIFPNTLEKLIHFHSENTKTQKIGIIGCRLALYNSPSIQQAYAGKFNKLKCIPEHQGENDTIDSEKFSDNYDYAIGASMLLSRKYIEEVGYMNEAYFLYFEELDLTLRGKKFGWKTLVDPSTYLYHKHGNSTGNNNAFERSEFSDIVLLKSKIYFIKKHYPLLIVIVLLSFPLVIINRIKRGQSKRLFNLTWTLFKAILK